MADTNPKTRKLNLDRTYVYQGIFYGPGPTEVPAGEVADSLEAKQKHLQSRGIAAPKLSDANKQEAPSIEQLPTGQQNPGAGDTTIASNAGKPGPGATAISPAQAEDQRANAEENQVSAAGGENSPPEGAAASVEGTAATAQTTPGRTVTTVPATKAPANKK